MEPTTRIDGAGHWLEYGSEATCLGLFMVSAAGFATLLQHPESPLALSPDLPSLVQRLPMGLAMGMTAIALIYSPLGRRSGAHMNPAVTLAFLRLGKIQTRDAAAYIAAQFVGGVVGIVIALQILRGLPAHPSVNFVATLPGAGGPWVAVVAEATMGFMMMTTVLTLSNTSRVSRWTGVAAGALVAAFITFEAPLSGMSLNPARTLGSNLLAGEAGTLWIYFVAPLVGMLTAAERYVRRHGSSRIHCAKLFHASDVRCIFCGYRPPAITHTPNPAVNESLS